MENLSFLNSLKQMSILDFEKRVKQFAFPENRGYINVEQLKEAFKDTNVFTNLGDRTTIQHKFYTCTFVADFPIGSGLDVNTVK